MTYWSIGVDPGSTIGLCVMRESEYRNRKPRVEAVTSVRTHEEAIEWVNGWSKIAWEHWRARLTIAVVERVVAVYPTKTIHAATARGRDLVRSTEVAVEIRVALRSLVAHVLEVPATTWRKGLTGSRSPKDAMIAACLPGACDLFVKPTNNHQRDAVGLARHGLIWARTEGRAALELSLASQQARHMVDGQEGRAALEKGTQ